MGEKLCCIRIRMILALLTLATLAAGCAKPPHQHELAPQIEGELLRRTGGAFYEVASVVPGEGSLTEDGHYVVDVEYSLRFKRSLDEFMAYLLENTSIRGRTNHLDVHDAVRERLRNLYGSARNGDVRTFSERFVFEERAWGWRLLATRNGIDLGL